MNLYPFIPPWRSPLSRLGASALGVWSGLSDAGTNLKCQGKKPVDATLNGAGGTRATGVFGPCIHLDGSTGYIEVPSQAGTGVGTYSPTIGTIVFWFRTTTTPGSHHTWLTGRGLTVSSASGAYVILLQSTAIELIVSTAAGGTAASITTATGYNDGLWHMVAAQFAQGNSQPQRLYVDGVLAGSTTSSAVWAINTSQPMRWGKSVDTFWGLFTGDMDPGAWFDVWLTADAIADLYRRGPAGFWRGPTNVALLSAAIPIVGPHRLAGIGGGLAGPYAHLAGNM